MIDPYDDLGTAQALKPKGLKVLMVCFVYNEKPYLPDIIGFWQRQNVDVFVIDNYSDDGTWEWLQERGIPSKRVSTKNSFDLSVLQRSVEQVLHGLKPDWVIYGAADLYYGFGCPIQKVIAEADSKGYNQIATKCWFINNTGEKRGLPLKNHYFYGEKYRDLTMISKYSPDICFVADRITLPDANPLFVDGVIINYGGCKTAKEQERKLMRRKLAWARGLNKRWGTHYLLGKKFKWVYSRKKMKDIRLSEESLFHKYILSI